MFNEKLKGEKKTTNTISKRSLAFAIPRTASSVILNKLNCLVPETERLNDKA